MDPYRPAVVAVVLLGTVAPLVGVVPAPVARVAADETAADGGAGEPPTLPPHAEVRIGCDSMRATVTPTDWSYYLILYFRDMATGRLIKTSGGPFRGTTTEPVDPDLVLTYVEVDVGGSIIGTAAIPERCYGVTGAAVAQRSNTRTKPSNTDAVSSAWTTEDASMPAVA